MDRLLALAALTIIAGRGIRASNTFNAVIVCVALGSLLFFALAVGLTPARGTETMASVRASETAGGLGGLLHAAALMFVAYTGYGRIATLGEEVRQPRRTIPLAIIGALLAAMTLYLLVAAAAVRFVGTATFGQLAEEGAPLQAIAREALGTPGSVILFAGAIAALLAVQFNLLLGLSRVVLAMARRRDLPGAVTTIHPVTRSPWAAVLVAFVIVALLAGMGSIRAAWSFSAFTVLLYYGITNAAALKLERRERLFPRAVAIAGLVGCLLLAFAIEPVYWLAGGGILATGFLLRGAGRAFLWKSE